ncbi:MAG: hypothetical protein AAGA78_14945 [Pseudomonadota bacterium]
MRAVFLIGLLALTACADVKTALPTDPEDEGYRLSIREQGVVSREAILTGPDGVRCTAPVETQVITARVRGQGRCEGGATFLVSLFPDPEGGDPLTADLIGVAVVDGRNIPMRLDRGGA